MNYFAIVSALNGLLTLFAGFYLLVRNPKNPLYVSFAVFSGTASLWAIFYAIWQCQTSKEQALFFVRLTLIPCYFICFAFLLFVLTLVQHERRNYFLPLCVLTPLFFALFGFSNLTIPDVVPRMYLPYWPVPGPLMHLYVLIFFIVLGYSFYLLFRTWASASGIRRWQLRWVTLPLLCVWLGGSTNWFFWYNIPIPPIPNIFVAVFFLIVAYAIIRRQLFDIDTVTEAFRREKLAAIGILAASINHEIKNPLFIIRGNLEICLRRLDAREADAQKGEETMRPLIEKSLSQIDRASEIMQRLNDFAKPEAGLVRDEEVSVKEAFERVIELINYQFKLNKIQLSQEIDPALTVVFNKRQFEEVLFNLILNACQSMPQGGELRLEALRKDERIQIRIRDSGCGIPSSDKEKVFEPFHSTKGNEGTGLGLYITRQLIEHRRGKIWFETSSRGTSFIVEFKLGTNKE